jgi:hypothetical protein
MRLSHVSPVQAMRIVLGATAADNDSAPASKKSKRKQGRSDAAQVDERRFKDIPLGDFPQWFSPDEESSERWGKREREDSEEMVQRSMKPFAIKRFRDYDGDTAARFSSRICQWTCAG